MDLAAVPAPWRALVAEINGGRVPDGTPGIRDVDAPCDAFAPGEPGHGTCDTDGHYICSECTEISERELRRRRDQCAYCGEPLSDPDTHRERCPNGCYDQPILAKAVRLA